MLNFVKRVGILILTNAFIMLGLYIVIYLIERFTGTNITWNADIMSLLVYGFVLGMGWSIVSLFMSKSMAKSMYGMKMLDRDNKHNYDDKIQVFMDVVRKVAESKWISLPELWIYKSPDPNAFATWSSKNNSLVAVSIGLLDNMNEEQISGVIWHEMAHVYNGDMVTMTLLQGIMNTFVFFLSRVIGVIRSSKDREWPIWYNPVMSFILEIVFGITATLIISRFSQYREFRADAGSAKTLWKQSMISALQQLKYITEGRSRAQNDQFSTMKINGGGGWLARLFATHPSLDRRIVRLQEMRVEM